MNFFIKYKILVIIVLILIAAVALADLLWLDPYLKNRVQSAIQMACPKCKVEIETLTTHLFTSSIDLDNVVFEDSKDDHTTIDFHLKHLTIAVNPRSLRDPLTQISEMEVTGLELTATDDTIKPKTDGAPFPVKNDDELSHLPPLDIRMIKLKECAFTYAARTVDRKRAHLSVYHINGELEPIITRAEFREDIKTHITAQLEKSGAVTIDLLIQPFLVDHHDHVSIKVEHQPLSEVNAMFETEDGIQFQGELNRIETHLTIHKGKLEGPVEINYKDLKLDVQSTATRGKVITAVVQAAQKLIVNPNRPKDEKDKPLAQVNYQREPNQSIFQFLLAGLKPAIASLVSKI